MAEVLPMQYPTDWSSFGPKMQGLRERERRFVWAYLINSMTEVGPNGAQSARDAGYSAVAGGDRVRASELLHRDDVQAAIHEVAARELRGLALPAVAALASILRKPDHPDRQKVALSILSRLGMGETSAVSLNVSGEVTVNHTDAALEALRHYKELGVPREKLEQIFGFSGLPRYERMLAERAPKLIEGEVVDRG